MHKACLTSILITLTAGLSAAAPLTEGPTLMFTQAGDFVGAGQALELEHGPPGGMAVLFVGPERADEDLRRHVAGQELGLRVESTRRLHLDERGRARLEFSPPLEPGTVAQALVFEPAAWAGAGPWLTPAARVTVPPGSSFVGPGQTGEVIVTEFMKDPTVVSDSNGEWLELYNTTSAPIDIEGWSLGDQGSNLYVIFNRQLGLWIPPGGRLLIGSNEIGAENGGLFVHNEWSSFTLSNGADEIELRKPDGTLVDSVHYDDGVLWPDLPGRSIQLRPELLDAAVNDLPVSWCVTDRPIHRNNLDTGTPARPNDPCGG